MNKSASTQYIYDNWLYRQAGIQAKAGNRRRLLASSVETTDYLDLTFHYGYNYDEVYPDFVPEAVDYVVGTAPAGEDPEQYADIAAFQAGFLAQEVTNSGPADNLTALNKETVCEGVSMQAMGVILDNSGVTALETGGVISLQYTGVLPAIELSNFAEGVQEEKLKQAEEKRQNLLQKVGGRISTFLDEKLSPDILEEKGIEFLETKAPQFVLKSFMKLDNRPDNYYPEEIINPELPVSERFLERSTTKAADPTLPFQEKKFSVKKEWGLENESRISVGFDEEFVGAKFQHDFFCTRDLTVTGVGGILIQPKDYLQPNGGHEAINGATIQIFLTPKTEENRTPSWGIGIESEKTDSGHTTKGGIFLIW